MDLKNAYKNWQEEDTEFKNTGKRVMPKRWKVKLDAYKNRKSKKQAMKKFNLRVSTSQIGYYTIEAKSLEEAVAQAHYQLLVNPPREIDGTIKEIKTHELVDLPKETMVIDQDYLEFTQEKTMARPKKKIQKREKLFDFLSKVIDLFKYRWKTVIKATVLAAGFSLFIYVVFFWIDTVQEIRFEIIYIQEIAVDKYFFTLDALFKSNWEVCKPNQLRSMMKKYLNRNHDVVGGADYIINIYKDDYSYKYQGKALEALKAL